MSRRYAKWLLAAVTIAAVAAGSWYVGSIGTPFLRWSARYSIAIYEGETPFALSPSHQVATPVLTPDDVKDAHAVAVADPFVLRDGDRYYLFFEVVNAETDKGEIAWAESRDGLRWTYGAIAVAEPFHLSYPQVFRWKEHVYMIPESRQDYSVRLYEAQEFPGKWRKVKTLLRGNYVDPSVFEYRGRWWMFVTDGGDALRLFSAPQPMGPWEEHPMSPIVTKNGHIARCGGRVLVMGDRVYRFAQDGIPTYGNQLWAFEVVSLTHDDYAERLVGTGPLLKASGSGWNANAMHHVDLLSVDGKWRAYVDGAARTFRFTPRWRTKTP